MVNRQLSSNSNERISENTQVVPFLPLVQIENDRDYDSAAQVLEQYLNDVLSILTGNAQFSKQLIGFIEMESGDIGEEVSLDIQADRDFQNVDFLNF